MEFVATTDWHFNKLANYFHDHLDRQVAELRKPFLYALKHGVRTVIVPGDISEDPYLDGPAETALLSLLIEFDKRLDIHIILGNHDFAHDGQHSLGPVSLLCKKRKLQTVTVYEKPEHIVIDGVNLNMLPFPYTAKDRKYKKAAFNVAHLEWNGAVRDNGVSRIKEGYEHGNGKDFWLMGHLHTPQYLEKARVLYIGTQYQTNFGETPDKSFVHGVAKQVGETLQVKWKRVAQRQSFMLTNLRINTDQDFQQLVKDPSHLFKLHLSRDVRLPKKLLEQYPNIVSWVGGVADSSKVEEREQSAGAFNRKTKVKQLLKAEGLSKQEIEKGFTMLKSVGEMFE